MDVKYLNPPLRYYQETAKDKFNFFLDGYSDAISSYAQKTKNNLLDVSNGQSATDILIQIRDESYAREKAFLDRCQTTNKKTFYGKTDKSISSQDYSQMMQAIFYGSGKGDGKFAFLNAVTNPGFASQVIDKYINDPTIEKRKELRNFIENKITEFFNGENKQNNIVSLLTQPTVQGKQKGRIFTKTLYNEIVKAISEQYEDILSKEDITNLVPQLKINNINFYANGQPLRYSQVKEASKTQELTVKYKLEMSQFDEISTKIVQQALKATSSKHTPILTPAISDFLTFLANVLKKENKDAAQYLHLHKNAFLTLMNEDPNIVKEIEVAVARIMSAGELRKITNEIDNYVTKGLSFSKENYESIMDKLEQFRVNSGNKNQKFYKINGVDFANNLKIFNQNKKDILDKLKQIEGGYVSKAKGSIGEIFYTAMLNANKKISVTSEGASMTETSENTSYEKHYDLKISSDKIMVGEGVNRRVVSVGAQIKIYTAKNDTFTFYEKLFKEGGGKGGFSLSSSSLEKYIGKNQFNDDSASGAIALQYLALNRDFFNDFNISSGVINEDFIMDVFEKRLSAFMRITDFLDDEDIQSNFFFINGYIIPTSIILNNYLANNMGAGFSTTEKSIHFPHYENLSNPSTESLLVSKNIDQLGDVRIAFKGIPVKITNIIV